MRTVEIKIYQFDELSPAAKEQARAWYRAGMMHDEWWQTEYDDADMIGMKLTGFDLDRNRHATGEFIQGAVNCAELIIKGHGKDCETHKTAAAFLSDLAKLNAEIEAVDGDDETNAEYEDWQGKRRELEAGFLKSILADYAVCLQNEMEYLQSDESVDENIKANEYEFTEDGKQFVVPQAKLSPGSLVVSR